MRQMQLFIIYFKFSLGTVPTTSRKFTFLAYCNNCIFSTCHHSCGSCLGAWAYPCLPSSMEPQTGYSIRADIRLTLGSSKSILVCISAAVLCWCNTCDLGNLLPALQFFSVMCLCYRVFLWNTVFCCWPLKTVRSFLVVVFDLFGSVLAVILPSKAASSQLGVTV